MPPPVDDSVLGERRPTGEHPVVVVQEANGNKKLMWLIIAAVVGASGASVVGKLGNIWDACTKAELVATKVEFGAEVIRVETDNNMAHNKIHGDISTTSQEIKKVGSDVRTIKCLMLATTKSKRDRCVLGD